MNKNTVETNNEVKVEVVETRWKRFKNKVKEAKLLQKAGLVVGGVLLGALAVSQYNKAKDEEAEEVNTYHFDVDTPSDLVFYPNTEGVSTENSDESPTE